jgi:hypothetical protein
MGSYCGDTPVIVRSGERVRFGAGEGTTESLAVGIARDTNDEMTLSAQKFSEILLKISSGANGQKSNSADCANQAD